MKYSWFYDAVFSWTQGANPSSWWHLKRICVKTCHSKVTAGIGPLSDATFSSETRDVTPRPLSYPPINTEDFIKQQILLWHTASGITIKNINLSLYYLFTIPVAYPDTTSLICMSNTRIPVHVCFIPNTTGPWYITKWFNLSRNLNNAIVPFVRINVPTGPAWSINIRWIVAFISVCVALKIPFRGVKGGSRADVWRHLFDAPFHSVSSCVYIFFSSRMTTLISN